MTESNFHHPDPANAANRRPPGDERAPAAQDDGISALAAEQADGEAPATLDRRIDAFFDRELDSAGESALLRETLRSPAHLRRLSLDQSIIDALRNERERIGQTSRAEEMAMAVMARLGHDVPEYYGAPMRAAVAGAEEAAAAERDAARVARRRRMFFASARRVGLAATIGVATGIGLWFLSEPKPAPRRSIAEYPIRPIDNLVQSLAVDADPSRVVTDRVLSAVDRVAAFVEREGVAFSSALLKASDGSAQSAWPRGEREDAGSKPASDEADVQAGLAGENAGEGAAAPGDDSGPIGLGWPTGDHGSNGTAPGPSNGGESIPEGPRPALGPDQPSDGGGRRPGSNGGGGGNGNRPGSSASEQQVNPRPAPTTPIDSNGAGSSAPEHTLGAAPLDHLQGLAALPSPIDLPHAGAIVIAAGRCVVSTAQFLAGISIQAPEQAWWPITVRSVDGRVLIARPGVDTTTPMAWADSHFGAPSPGAI